MRHVLSAAQTNGRDPLVHQARILAGAHLVCVIDPAWKDEVASCPSTALQPGKQAPTDIDSQLELDWLARLVLHHDRTRSDVRAGKTLRKRLLEKFDFHTLLRLPTGIFYSQGVKANVLFLDRATPGTGIATRNLWVYDLRTNQRFTRRERPLKRADLDDFVASHGSKYGRQDRVESERFRRFGYDDHVKRDRLNLDLFWLKDAGATEPDTLPPPAEIAAEIVDSLETALEKFRLVAASLARLQP